MYIGIIAKLAVKKMDALALIEKIDNAIELLLELDGPSELSKSTMPAEPVKPKRTCRKRKAAKPEPKHVAGHRGPLKKASQYKGVSLCKMRKNGTQKWRVQYYDPSVGKIKSLGAYDTELKAAAAYQDYVGDKAAAAEYRRLDAQQRGMARQQAADMAEQVENNPDKPTGKKKDTYYVCDHCKLETLTRPTSCIQCRGASFSKKRD